MFDPASAQGLDCIFGPFQSSVLWFSGISGKISWSRWEYHPPDQKGQKDTVTPGNNINRRTPDMGKSSYCFVVLYLLVWFFSCFIIPFCSLCRVYYTDLLICCCGTFITHNITHERVSHRHHFSSKHNRGNGRMKGKVLSSYSHLWRSMAAACCCQGF